MSHHILTLKSKYQSKIFFYQKHAYLLFDGICLNSLSLCFIPNFLIICYTRNTVKSGLTAYSKWWRQVIHDRHIKMETPGK